MEFVKPQVYHVASTRCHSDAIMAYLKDIGAEEWRTDPTSDAELLLEVAGRACYRSFKEGLNANVTKVREGNALYLGNILKSKHGSVLEHAYDTYIFHNISRVFTHELVRHRAGCAYSQESLRFVRLDELRTWYPTILTDLPTGASPDDMSRNDAHLWLQNKWLEVITYLEGVQKETAAFFNLDRLPFDLKKKLTSVMRRWAPLGLATTIMMTGNHRVWRHLITMRTSRHAEEEIRLVFNQVYKEQKTCYPSLYQDAKETLVDGMLEITFENEKV